MSKQFFQCIKAVELLPIVDIEFRIFFRIPGYGFGYEGVVFNKFPVEAC